MSLRSAVSVLTLVASPVLAQGRAVDQGTFMVSKGGSQAFTESFKITRGDGGTITATSHQVTGQQQITSSLITDTLGTPIKYELHVTDKGAPTLNVTAVARAGRLTALSSTKAGDESMREYPMTPGRTIILDAGLLHQLYFVALGKRPESFQVIEPRGARGVPVTLTPRGLEPVGSATATHYSLVAGPARYEFWVDAQGRLLRVEVPNQGLVATREEAPR